jgi:hypothetical protein
VIELSKEFVSEQVAISAPVRANGVLTLELAENIQLFKTPCEMEAELDTPVRTLALHQGV